MSTFAPLLQKPAKSISSTRVRQAALPAKRRQATPLADLQDAQHQLDQSRLSRLPIQAKLEVSQPGDALEQEADRVAEDVMQARELSAVTNPTESSTLAGNGAGAAGSSV